MEENPSAASTSAEYIAVLYLVHDIESVQLARSAYDLGDQWVLVCCGGDLQPSRLCIVAQPPPPRPLCMTDVPVKACLLEGAWQLDAGCCSTRRQRVAGVQAPTCTAAVLGLNLEMRLSTDPNSASIAFASSPPGGTKSCDARRCQQSRLLQDVIRVDTGNISKCMPRVPHLWRRQVLPEHGVIHVACKITTIHDC